MAEKITQKTLDSFIKTYGNHQDASDEKLLEAFPEFGGNASLLKSAKSYYKTRKNHPDVELSVVNEKFPEFFSNQSEQTINNDTQVSVEPITSAQEEQKTSIQLPSGNAFVPLAAQGMFSREQAIAKQEYDIKKEQSATMPITEEDKAQKQELENLKSQRYSFAQLPGSQSVIEREARISDLEKNLPSYMTNSNNSIDEVANNTFLAAIKNTDDGKRELKVYEDEMAAKSSEIDKALSQKRKELQTQVNAGKISVEEANKELDALKREKQSEYDTFMDEKGKVLYSNVLKQNEDFIKKEQRRLGQERVDFNVSTYLPVYQEAIKRLKKSYSNSGAYDYYSRMAESEKIAPEVYYNEMAIKLLNRAKEISDAAKEGKNFFQSFGKTISDLETWDLGISELVRGVKLLDIAEKKDKFDETGDKKYKLTAGEEALLNAAAVYSESVIYNSDLLSRFYKAGESSAASVPFMLQFALMPISAIKNNTARAILRSGTKAAVKRSAATNVMRHFGAELAGTLAAAGVQTLAFSVPKIVGGTVERVTGDIVANEGEGKKDEKIEYSNRENKQGVGEAFYNSLVENYVENFSEIAFGSLRPFGLAASHAKWFAGVKNSSLGRLIAGLRMSPVGRFASRAQWNGIIEEQMEEELGGALRLLCTDVNTIKEAGLDPSSQIDTFLALAPTSLVFGGGRVISHYGGRAIDVMSLRHKLKTEADKNFLDSILKEARSGEFAKKANMFIYNIIGNNEYSPEEKRNILIGIASRYQDVISRELEGSIDGVVENELGENIRSSVDVIKNNVTGKIYAAVDKGGRNLVIVDGNVELKKDGTIDASKSSDVLKVRYIGKNGVGENIHTTKPSLIASEVAVISPHEQVELRRKREVAKLLGRETFEANGSTYRTADFSVYKKPEAVSEEKPAPAQPNTTQVEPQVSQPEPNKQETKPVDKKKTGHITNALPIVKEITVEENGEEKKLKVRFSSGDYFVEEDGSINPKKTKHFSLSILEEGKKPQIVLGERKEKLFNAFNSTLKDEQSEKIDNAEQAQAAAQQQAAEAVVAEQNAASDKKDAEEKAKKDAEEKAAKTKELSDAATKKNGELDEHNATPEQIVCYMLTHFEQAKALDYIKRYIVRQTNERAEAKDELQEAKLDLRIDAFYAAVRDWVSPEAETAMRVAVAEETKPAPVAETPAPVAPVAKEEPKKETQKEPKQEKKPKEQKTPKVETPATEPAKIVEPTQEKEEKLKKPDGWKEGMIVKEPNIHLVYDGKLHIKESNEKELPGEVRKKYIYLPGDNTPYLVYSKVAPERSKSIIRYLDNEGNIRSVDRGSVYIMDSNGEKKLLPSTSRKPHVTSFDSLLKAPLRIGNKTYRIEEYLVPEEIKTPTERKVKAKKGSKESVEKVIVTSYQSGYKKLMTQIEKDFGEKRALELKSTVIQHIYDWLTKWNSYADWLKDNISAKDVSDEDLRSIMAMKLWLNRPLRDMAAKKGNLDDVKGIQTEMEMLTFDVKLSPDKDRFEASLRTESLINPLYQLAAVLKVAQNIGKAKEDIQLGYPNYVKLVLNSTVVTPKQIDKERKEYAKAKGHKKENIKTLFPEVENGLPALTRFAITPEGEGTRTPEVTNKAYDASLKDVYKQMAEALKSNAAETAFKKEEDELSKMLKEASEAAESNNMKAFEDANKRISSFIAKHSKEDSDRLRDAVRDAQVSLSSKERKAHPDFVKYESLLAKLNKRQGFINDARSTKSERSNNVEKLREKLEGAQLAHDEFVSKYPEKDDSRYAERVIAAQKKLDEAIAIQGKAITQDVNELNQSLASAKAELDAFVKSHNGIKEEYEKYTSRKFPADGLRIELMAEEEEVEMRDDSEKHGEYVINVMRNLGIEVDEVTEEELLALLPKEKAQELRDSKNVLYGGSNGKKIWVVKELLNPNTPVHEYGHIWIHSFAINNPTEWAKMIEVLKTTDMWKDVISRSAYKDLNDDSAVANEVMARLLGDFYAQRGIFGTTRFEEKTAAASAIGLARIKKAIRQILQWIFDKFNYDLPLLKDKNFNSTVRELLSRPINDLIAYGGERGAIIAKANTKQKQIDSIFYTMTRRTGETIRGWLNKREDLTETEKSAVIAAIDELESNKLQLVAGKWFANGTIRIPEDLKKIRQAVAVADRAKVDALQYDSPMSVINAFPEIEIKDKPIDPSTVSTLRLVESYDNGIAIYDVDDSQESRENMRQIINTHFGKDCSPWCLLQGDKDGNLTEDSEYYWNHYNTYPKQVAFKDGHLMAFSANDNNDVVWWDRQDEPQPGIYVGMKEVEGGLTQASYFVPALKEDKGSGVFIRESANGRVKEEFDKFKNRFLTTIQGDNGSTLEIHYNARGKARALTFKSELGTEHYIRIASDGSIRESLFQSSIKREHLDFDNNETDTRWFDFGDGSLKLVSKVSYRDDGFLRSIKETDVNNSKTISVFFGIDDIVHELSIQHGQNDLFSITYDKSGRNRKYIYKEDEYNVDYTGIEPTITLFHFGVEKEIFRKYGGDYIYVREKGAAHEEVPFTNEDEEYQRMMDILAGIEEEARQLESDSLVEEIYTDLDNGAFNIAEDYFDLKEFIEYKMRNDFPFINFTPKNLDGGLFDGINLQVEEGIMYLQAEEDYKVTKESLYNLSEDTADRIRREEDEAIQEEANPESSDELRMNKWEKAINAALDMTEGLRKMQNSIEAWRKSKGYAPSDDKFDIRARFEAKDSIAKNKMDILNSGIEKELEDAITDLEKVVAKSEFYQKYKQEIGGENPAVLTPVQLIERYLMARNNWERAKEGNARGLAEFKQRMGFVDNRGVVNHVGSIEFAKEFHTTFDSTGLVENLWKNIRKMTDFALDTNYEGGLISREVYERLKSKQYYVPQRGFWSDINVGDSKEEQERQKELDELRRRMHNGTAAKNKLDSMHKAEGGKSLAEGCLSYIKRDAYEAIAKSENNKVLTALFDYLRENDGWCHDVGFKVPRVVRFYTKEDGSTGRVEDDYLEDEVAEFDMIMAECKAAISSLKTAYNSAQTEEEKESIADEIAQWEERLPYFDEKDSYRIAHTTAKKNKALVTVNIDGVPCHIEFPKELVSIADALNGRRNTEWDMPDAIKKACSFMASVYTVNNPTFFIVNIVRDTPFILLKGTVEYGPGFRLRFTKNWAKAQGVLWEYVHTHKIPNSKFNLNIDGKEMNMGELLEEFLMSGGNTGYSSNLDLQQFRKSVANLDSGLSHKGRTLKKIGSWVALQPVANRLNEISELVSRFAAYCAVREMGKSSIESAKAARNLSVNFNRRGLGTPFLNAFNSLTVFANAAIQGASGFWRAFGGDGNKAKRITRAITCMMVEPALLGFISTMLQPDDPKDEYTPSEWTRYNYAILGPIKIPLNEQLKPFWGLGVSIALALRGQRSLEDAANAFLTSFVTNLLPLPQNLTSTFNMLYDGEDQNIGQYLTHLLTISPMEPLYQIAENRNFMGGSLRYDFGDIPEFKMGRDSAVLFQDIARGMYILGGGRSTFDSKHRDPDSIMAKLFGEKMGHIADVNPRQVKLYLYTLPSGYLDILCTAYGLGKAGVEKLTKGTYDEDDIRTQDMPIVNRFYKPERKSAFRFSVIRRAREIIEDTQEQEQNYLNEAMRLQQIAMSPAYSEKERIDAQKGIKDAMNAYARVAYTSQMLQEFMTIENYVSAEKVAKSIALSKKELKKMYPGINFDSFDKAEKGNIRRMLNMVRIHDGVPVNPENPEWIQWFDNKVQKPMMDWFDNLKPDRVQ